MLERVEQPRRLRTAHAGRAPATTTTVEINVATKPLAARRDAYVFRLAFGGRTRDVRLHVPPAAATGRPLPLILNLHGATQNGFLEEAQTGMDASSDRDGYLVAYPDGTRIATKLTPDPVAKDAQYGWNAGYCCGLPVTKHVDDVGFLLAVISDIATRTPVNLRRVYVTGISNGGMMAYAMAADASDRIAAIASVEGQVELPAINPARPVPTLEYHSVDDPVAKWDGVPSKDPDLRFSVMSGVDQWVKADGCEPTPHAQAPIVGAAGSRSAGETATLVTYRSCRDGSDGEALALHRFRPRVARRAVQHRSAQHLDPRRRRSGDHPRERERRHVAVLRASRTSGRSVNENRTGHRRQPGHRQGDRDRVGDRRLRRRDPGPHRARRRSARAQLHAGTLRHLSPSRVTRQHGRADPCDRTPVRRAVAADLLDHPSLERAVDAVLGEWGHIDVLVNNGRYIGPGHMDRILDTPVQLLRDHLEANALAPIVLIKAVVPQMIERGGGTIIDITSTVAYEDPADPAGEGGWGLGYAFSKGALHRIAGVLAVEQRNNNVRAYNVQPGFIATERIRQDMAAFGFDASAGAPAEVVAKVCRWLLESPDAPAP